MWQFPSGNPFKASHSKVRAINAVSVREGMSLSGVPDKWQVYKISVYPPRVRSVDGDQHSELLQRIWGPGPWGGPAASSDPGPGIPVTAGWWVYHHLIVVSRKRKAQGDWNLPRETQWTDVCLLYWREELISWHLDQIYFPINQDLDFVCRWNLENG
jgi:hypothetical protein